MLSHAETKAIYDRLGVGQEKGSYFEAPALAILRQQAEFAHARAVFEFGCGTGSFAAILLAQELAADAHYLGLDQSSTMVQLAATQVGRFGLRAAVVHSGGEMIIPLRTGAVDRFVSNYVLDLLPPAEIHQLIVEAHRVLTPAGGLLCLTSLTHGTTPFSRLVMAGWQLRYQLYPASVGGCRPIRVNEFLDATQWGLCHRSTSITRGLASEIVIAARR